MKTKSSLWLSICTLVLCMGVMTFGVYSALSANLNIGGTLGFNMHNCMITVSGSIYNVAETSDNWVTATPATKTLERTIMGGESKTVTTLNIGDLYFYKQNISSALDIIFEITFTNIFEKSIQATIPKPEVGANVTVLHNDTTNNYVDFTNSYQTVIEKNKSVTIRFALKLNDISSSNQNIKFEWNNLIFEEYKLNLVKYDEAKDYYYIEMGTNPYRYNEPLRWFAYAQRKTDGTLEYIPNSVEPTSNNTYYFISELVFKTEDTNDTSSGGLPYQNTLTVSGMAATVTGTSYSGADYAVSNIRKYLNGETVKNGYTSSGNNPNMVYSESGTPVTIDFYNIRTSDVYINNITPIALSELYNGPYNCGNEADKLWLISDDDLSFILEQYGHIAESTNYIESQSKGTKTFSYFGRTANGTGVSKFTSGIVYNLLAERFDTGNSIVYLTHGVRPAFQITIP